MVPPHIQLASSTFRKVIKRLHYPLEVMLLCVRWYAAYPLSLRNLEEMMSMRWISDAELDANPGLVRSMSVQPRAAPAACACSRSRASTCNLAAART